MSPQIVSCSLTFLEMRHLIKIYLLNPVSFSSSQQGENSKIMFPQSIAQKGKHLKVHFLKDLNFRVSMNCICCVTVYLKSSWHDRCSVKNCCTYGKTYILLVHIIYGYVQ